MVGTAGYVVVEGMSLLDAFYMAVITLSTVGYAEVTPLHDAGKLFSIGLIMTGLGIALYTVGTVAEFFIGGGMRGFLSQRSMTKSLSQLHHHTILCGYGRFGAVVGDAVAQSDQPLVIIDRDRSLEPGLVERGLLHVIGSAIEEQVLEAAGIRRARALVTTIPDDSDNVFITLSARELNPDLLVHARAESEAGARRLRLAGAEQVVRPYELGGRRIANALLHPSIIDFVEPFFDGAGDETDLEEVMVAERSVLEGKPVGDLRRRELEIALVAVKREGERTRLTPSPRLLLRPGDRLVAVGDRAQLLRLADLAQAGSGASGKEG
ncbi:MAG: potassium channel protein [Proteobacteria bacterium]|nr:potassium channel protein [Pseudomonadota bacterium]